MLNLIRSFQMIFIPMLGLLRMSEFMCTYSTSSVDLAWKCISSKPPIKNTKKKKKIPYLSKSMAVMIPEFKQ